LGFSWRTAGASGLIAVQHWLYAMHHPSSQGQFAALQQKIDSSSQKAFYGSEA
jgi:hypothetical protein